MEIEKFCDPPGATRIFCKHGAVTVLNECDAESPESALRLLNSIQSILDLLCRSDLSRGMLVAQKSVFGIRRSFHPRWKRPRERLRRTTVLKERRGIHNLSFWVLKRDSNRSHSQKHQAVFFNASIISDSCGNRPCCFLEKMSLPSCMTSNTPPDP